jgi:glycosyltransferase involved in cell wall biosynthesis
MERLCRTLGTCEDIRFLGKLEAVEEVLSVADLFLMPSEKESFGLAALEAMACEVPVLSSNAGGIPELNLDGVTGFACEVGDVEDMTKKRYLFWMPPICQDLRSGLWLVPRNLTLIRSFPCMRSITAKPLP